MKKTAWITGVLTGLMVLLAALGALGMAVKNIAGDETLYAAQSRQAVMQAHGFSTEAEVTAYIGLEETAQQDAAGKLAAYVTGGADELPTVLNENERAHMRDVRGIVVTMADMGRMCLTLAAALAVVTAWTGAKQKRRLPGILGTLAAVGLLALLAAGTAGMAASGGFERMFVAMHEVLFDNELWLMNPETDILIRMMPTQLFEQAFWVAINQALRVLLIVWAMLLAVQEIVTNMIRRHVSGGEHT